MTTTQTGGLMSQLITSQSPATPKIIVYGQPGVGKTTFAAEANAILLDCENGAGAIPNLKRTPYLQSWPEMWNWLSEIAKNPPKDTPAIAIDTIDWMVRRITEYVVIDLDGKKSGNVTNTIGRAHDGFFNAREIVKNIIHRFLFPALNHIADSGMAVILLAHAANAKIVTPEGYNHQLAAPDLPDQIRSLFVEWSDAVLYAHYDNTEGRAIKSTANNLILAKNRYNLPTEFPLSWKIFIQEFCKHMKTDFNTKKTNNDNKKTKKEE